MVGTHSCARYRPSVRCGDAPALISSSRSTVAIRQALRRPLLALIERFVHPLDRQLAGVKLTLSPNRRTVTVDPKPTSLALLCIGKICEFGATTLFRRGRYSDTNLNSRNEALAYRHRSRPWLSSRWQRAGSIAIRSGLGLSRSKGHPLDRNRCRIHWSGGRCRR